MDLLTVFIIFRDTFVDYLYQLTIPLLRNTETFDDSQSTLVDNLFCRNDRKLKTLKDILPWSLDSLPIGVIIQTRPKMTERS